MLALVVLASAIAIRAWYVTPPNWTDPDSLFYRAAVLRIEGTGKQEALTRVVASDIARVQRVYDHGEPPRARRVTKPAWMTYSARFYDRRWVFPLAGAALDPLFGANGLIVASLIAYVLLAPCLYLLLRQRFPSEVSAVVTGGFLLLHTVREWSTWPMTDMWGLSLECLALAVGLIALERGGRWIAAWGVVVLLLAFTRDTTLVLIAGALAAFATRRDRRAAAVLATGVIAALPAPLLFGASFRELVAYTVNNFYPPPSTSWSFILDHFLPPLRDLVRQDLLYLRAHLVDAVALVGGFVALLPAGRLLGPGTSFVFGAAAASLATLLLVPNYSLFRLELVVVPFAALGIAAAATAVERRAERRAPVVAGGPGSG